jgi:hypothetical protein
VETCSSLREKAARHRRLAAALVNDTRASEALSAMADEFEAQAVERAARDASQKAGHLLADSIEMRSADAAVVLCMRAGGDIYRTAILLVREHGPTQAPFMAATRADALHHLGCVDGERLWRGVLRAVQELIRPNRAPGERLN